ncbi:host specificity protein J [Salmonella enterica]|nr:host specificity protein J [Salmonella enterica]EJX3319730.1 host specificity protein J [Salmonella enterica]ELG7088360.1 host specificity protein J [Salmonella enterica]ELL0619790.1 host specificity protein J [Salmonella enterica]ELL0633548.1 host specificity protein J [Salmonella enterica]
MSKGGGKGHTPYEAPDSLKSTQLLSLIDAIGEGPIKGPANGMQSILINNTPLVDADGNYNVHGVTVVYRVGENEQTPLEGFEESGAETLLGVEVKHDNPITRTITSKEIDRLRITFGTPYLQESNDKGDRNETSLNLLIQFQRNGSWITEKDITIHGKTTTQFLASVLLGNLPPRPFNVRMVRVTPDSTTDQLQNKSLWSSYTEIIDLKQAYPNTAVVGLQVDAEQFGSQQVTVNYHIYGRIMQVPSNYDPDTRTYTGLWDGTFKPAYTNSPAWCVMDMLTHPLYGMGQAIGVADVDKWALYAIAQYCDQRVPDGFGGQEPRMTLNAYIAQQRKAYDVLADFCSVMRCMPVWNGSTMTFVQDRPADKVWTYTNSNVVGGQFKYSYSALKDRHNAVEVRYTDPLNGWKTSTELVEDHASQIRYGRNLLKMDAFGCTSRGQAHRMGLWVITTELLETQSVDFSVGAEGLRHTPGDIIEVCDNDYAGASIGGRITDLDISTRTLTLDREITLPESGSATLNIAGPDGTPFSTEIQSQPAPDRVVLKVLPETLQPYSIWGLKLPSLKRRLFRCVRIAENDDGTYAITAVQHVPEKESIVDNGAHFDPLPGTTNGIIPPAVQHLVVDTDNDSILYQAKAKWDTPRVVKGVRFVVRLTTGSGKEGDPVRLVTTATTSETEYAFHELPLGDYTLTVRAINGFGQQGEPSSVTFSIQAPVAPSTIELTPGYFQITVTPYQSYYDPGVQYEFWYSPVQLNSADEITSKAQRLGIATYWVKDGLMLLGTDYWFYVRSVNMVGKSAFAEASGQVKSDAEGVLELIKGQITANLLNREFLGTIDNEVVKSEFEKTLQLSEENVQQQLTEMKKAFGDDVDARIQKLEQVISGPDGSIGQKIEQINAALGKQSVTVEDISKAQATLNDAVAAIKSFKVQYQANGQAVIAGLQLSATQEQSQILMMADRIAFLNPQNGSVALPFVIQNGQIILAESFVKSLNVNGRVIVTPDGEFTMRADPTRNVGLVLTSRGFTIFDEQSRPRFEAGELY